MAEHRGYFDLRNLIPGYTFLSLVIAINFIPIMAMIQLSDIMSIFGALIALVGSPALGFLINQIWWWYFQSRIVLYDWIPSQALITKFKLTAKKNKQDKRKVLLVYDYILYKYIYSNPEIKAFSEYLIRRWDMLVLLSITTWSLTLGTAIGVFLRILSEIFYFKNYFLAIIHEKPLFFLDNIEFWILLFVLIGVIVLILFLRHGQRWVLYEYNRMHEVTIRSLDINILDDLRKLFPQDFFEN